MGSKVNAATDADRIGSFSYMAGSAQPSLYRNGKVLARRDADGSDGDWLGVDLEQREMPVHDARLLEATARRTLTDNGFEVLASPLANPSLDFIDHDQVVHDYYPRCAEIVREASGARFVAAFDHNVRSAAGKDSKRRIEGGQQVQGPAHLVHGDYTLTSAPQRLRDLARPPTKNDTLSKVLANGDSLLDAAEVERAIADGRFAIINLWRNIAPEPVATHPLALCDAATVDPDNLVVFEIHYGATRRPWIPTISWSSRSIMVTASARTTSPNIRTDTDGTSIPGHCRVRRSRGQRPAAPRCCGRCDHG